MVLGEVAARIAAGEAVVAGCLSGTSADGIDCALVSFPPFRAGDADLGAPDVLAFETAPFPAELGRRVRAVLDGEPLDARGVALLSRDLGAAFGAAVRALADDRGAGLDLVGSHGQTAWHHDGVEPDGRATLQLGDGDHVAAAARATTVSDFRQADVAAGGEGAPLSALADGVLFAALERPAAVLNLGGVANLTLLGEADDVRAFDVGPANALLDGLARRLLRKPFVANGAEAARGGCDERLLRAWLAHPFFAAPPPKSTGRDTFGEPWIDGLLAGAAGARPEDLLCTAVELVATAVADALRLHGASALRRLVVCGGGVHHGTLMAALGRRTGLPVVSSEAAGVDPDAREALVFAVLAARAVLGLPSTLPGATGAIGGRVLGKISPFLRGSA